VINRSLYQTLWQKLSKDGKMVFLSGPRQSGKTTFAKTIASTFTNKLYFNWDILSDKKRFSKNPTFFQELDRKDSSPPLVILDEIHKYRRWKEYLKGVFDEFSNQYHFLVTGSGRLDIGQKGGDALSGRYFQMNLFPFSLSELSSQRRSLKEFLSSPLQNFDLNKPKETRSLCNRLLRFGPFPEPFAKCQEDFLIRWSDTYIKQIIREDIRSFFSIKQVDTLELMVSLLSSKVGSPFSIHNVSNDLQLSFDTVKNWLRILDMFYIVFTVGTWTKKISRSILKEKKIYLYNYTEIEDLAIRFENMVALELYKTVLLWNHAGLGKFNLHYLKNKEKQEVDFILTERNSPIVLIETKQSDENVSKSLIYFQNKLQVPAIQLIEKDNIYRTIKNGPNQILLISAHRWLSSLPGIQ